MPSHSDSHAPLKPAARNRPSTPRAWLGHAVAATRRRWLAAVCVILLLVVVPSLAHADGDPASDYLLVSPVFYPYQPSTARAISRALEAELTQLKDRGLNLKVAIIAGPTDLGAVSNLWDMPQAYATFLDREISFNRPQPLLVVMPAGYGTSHAGPRGALSGAAVDSSHGADGLARSAITAVLDLARAGGRALPTPTISAVAGAAQQGSGASSLLTFGAPVLLILIAAGAAAVLHRRPGEERDGN